MKDNIVKRNNCNDKVLGSFKKVVYSIYMYINYGYQGFYLKHFENWFTCMLWNHFRGTEKQAVAKDYAMRLARGNYECQVGVIQCNATGFWYLYPVLEKWILYMYISTLLPLLHCTLQYFKLVTHEITSHLESRQWCLQKAVSKTKGGASRSDVL